MARIIEAVLATRWRGLLLLAAALLTGLLTMLVSYSVARGDGDIEVNDDGQPAISDLGDKMPEHAVFAVGFTLLAAQLVLLVLVARLALLRAAVRLGSSRSPPPLVHSLVAGLGLAAVPFLCLMAWIPDSASPVHFISALIMFGVLALYEVAFSILAIAVLRRAPAWPWPLALLMLWLLGCALGAVICAGYWVMSTNNVFEYLAVALEFAFFAGYGWIFEFGRGPSLAETPLLNV